MIECELRKQVQPNPKEVDIVLEVFNGTDLEITDVTVDWGYRVEREADPTRKLWSSAKHSEGKVAEFVPLEDGPIPPGQTRQFVLTAENVGGLKSETQLAPLT